MLWSWPTRLSNRLEFTETAINSVRYTLLSICLCDHSIMPKVVKTSKAPKPSGVYSQGIVSGDFVFVAGQGPINPKNNQLERGDIRSETRTTLKNIAAILEAAGSSLRNVVSVGVFLADLKDFDAMNEVYREFFTENPPARTTVGCSLSDIKVEIDCIARLDSASRVRGRNRNSTR